jgi:hypothetical protein
MKVPGLKIFALGEIKELMAPRDLPCLMPHPKNFITDLQVVHDSMGRGNDKVTYILNYRLYFRPVVGTVKFFGPYAALIDMVVAILDKIILSTPPTYAFDMMPRSREIGGVDDHAGNMYHGCDFEISVIEQLEQ